MNCAFCLEPMNDGATVCKACGRKHAASSDVIGHRIGVSVVVIIAIAVLVLVAFFSYQWIEHSNAVLQVKMTAAWCDVKISDASAEKMAELPHSLGESWSEVIKTFQSTASDCDFFKRLPK